MSCTCIKNDEKYINPDRGSDQQLITQFKMVFQCRFPKSYKHKYKNYFVTLDPDFGSVVVVQYHTSLA